MLRQFAVYYRPWMGLFWLDFGCAVLSGLLELAFPLAVRGYIDWLLPQGNWPLTVLCAIALCGIYLLNAGLTAIVIYWGHMLGINIETEMRRRAFDHLQRLSWGYFDRQHSGRMVARVTRDLEDIGEVAHHGPEDLIVAVMTFVGAFALMMMVHVQLAWITAVIVPLAALLVIYFGGKMTATWQAIYDRVGNFNVRIEENVGGIRVVQAFGNEDHERALFARDNASYRTTKLAAYKVMSISATLNYVGMRAVQVMVMVAGAGFVLNGSLSAGGFVAFLLLVGVYFRPLEKIAAVIETYPKGIAGFRRYLDLMATKPDVVDKPGAVPAPVLQGAVQFDHVSFGYDAARPVLRDVSFSVQPGQTVAFVGASGAGKTTLLALLPRFYEPTSGRISIDGIALDAMTLASLRAQIGIVSQDVFLFSGTLRDNIGYGRLGASDAEILAAAASAQLEATIAALPQGLDTVVGERGVMLSGGQKQRVAIARVFLKNPPLLILDEATSALDTQTEREIQAALDRLSAGRTTFIIAHRLGTIRHADKIVVMDQGQVVEVGTHGDLSQRGGRYADLHAA
ncbi:multidrug ABC transporter ATP-binding protein [Cypionkella aquatica]|uniref:Multidrug ABC transporter ATP-binding protein n=1 Tax=Cypionkella aquatica TaxID=1756042 RepID=A0AA37U1T9_9RHOB|nr:ABC transporter ATP-binding protein [Cypionkella aquatica]GLS85960.1 multidrug ABC transporter ATP-binding protein [Cypionkella aquatica]